MTGTQWIAEAAKIWEREKALSTSAKSAWKVGFGSGAVWMADTLAIVRHEERDDKSLGAATLHRLNALGFLKNGGAVALAALIAIATGILAGGFPGILLAAIVFVLGFYAIEGQMVFLLVLALDRRGEAEPSEESRRDRPKRTIALLREARAWTVRAGGTIGVMRVVMPISASMMFGGFLGRGFLRSWCLGCIAVVLWYDALAKEA